MGPVRTSVKVVVGSTGFHLAERYLPTETFEIESSFYAIWIDPYIEGLTLLVAAVGTIAGIWFKYQEIKEKRLSRLSQRTGMDEGR